MAWRLMVAAVAMGIAIAGAATAQIEGSLGVRERWAVPEGSRGYENRFPGEPGPLRGVGLQGQEAIAEGEPPSAAGPVEPTAEGQEAIAEGEPPSEASPAEPAAVGEQAPEEAAPEEPPGAGAPPVDGSPPATPRATATPPPAAEEAPTSAPPMEATPTPASEGRPEPAATRPLFVQPTAIRVPTATPSPTPSPTATPTARPVSPAQPTPYYSGPGVPQGPPQPAVGTPAAESARPGAWRGMTSQGRPISFTVHDSSIASISFGYSVGGCGGLEGQGSARFEGPGVFPPPIDGGEFSVVTVPGAGSGSGIVVASGRFTSPTAASGTLKVTLFVFGGSESGLPCVANVDVTWNATAQ